MPPESDSMPELDRMARDWMVRVQLGDASGPGETDGARAEALAAFEAWRTADPAHTAAVERMKASVGTVNRLPTGRLFMTSKLSRASFPERHPLYTAALMAGLVAAAGMGFYRFAVPGEVKSPVAAVMGGDAMYATRVGETRDITLPDGSKVLLDADSQLRVQYSASARNLRLDRGRARFTVAHEAKRPFAVNAGDGQVVAHGTIFDVTVTARGVHVALLRGAIEVARPAGRLTPSGEMTSRQLTPGQELSFARNTSLPLPDPTFIDGLNWVSGRLSFEDARLGDAVDEINRYNNLKIVLAEPALGDLRVSGGFDARKPQAFASAVAAALGLRVISQSDGRLSLAPGYSPGG